MAGGKFLYKIFSFREGLMKKNFFLKKLSLIRLQFYALIFAFGITVIVYVFILAGKL